MTKRSDTPANWQELFAKHKAAIDNDRVIRLQELKNKIGLSKSAIYNGVDKGTFPPPIKLGVRAVGWRLSSINAWIEAAELASGVEG